jgi:hypothetical protein
MHWALNPESGVRLSDEGFNDVEEGGTDAEV